MSEVLLNQVPKYMFPEYSSEFTYTRTYSRWKEDEGRRETWEETVQRYIDFIKAERGDKIPPKVIKKMHKYILEMGVMPSMRALWAAGEAAKRDNTCMYNCSTQVIDSPEAFAECLYILMCGTGYGFSVQNVYVNSETMPVVPTLTSEGIGTVVIADNKAGWADSLKTLFSALYQGKDVDFDYSLIRKKGEKLKTMGGRASGSGPLIKLHNFIRETFSKAQGSKLTSLECHDICNEIAEIVVVGGVRRSSQISISDLNDDSMRNAKVFPFPPRRYMANNSAAYLEKPSAVDFLKEWSSLASSGSGERGIFNLGAAKKNSPKRRDASKIASTNPCITGDTLVYVADGRVDVPISKLAEENKDVDVFCLDNNGHAVVRTMRNPRITGYDVPVFKITLDDGSIIKATENHKFLLKSGKYEEVKNLKRGDSLSVLTKNEASLQEVFKNSNSRSQDYIWLNTGFRKTKAEHRIIAEFYNNTKIQTGYVVHHKDYNAKNNHPSNLQIMSKEDHDYLHSKDMLGDKNPMRRAHTEWSEAKWEDYRRKQSKKSTGDSNGRYLGVTNEELREHAKNLCLKLGRRFSTEEWAKYAKENKLPQIFSKWRRDHLGGVYSLSKWAAIETGTSVDIIHLDTRQQENFKRYTEMGYNCEIVNGEISFIKNCEYCGKEFSSTKRETGVCSITCANKSRDRNIYKLTGLAIKNAAKIRHKKLRIKQIEIFNNLKLDLGRTPFKKEWQNKCRELGISPEVSRESSPFVSWEELKDAAFNYNHKVVSVEFYGYENVYNGTVDEFHNFYIGGFVSKTLSGKKKTSYFNNLQCGEILLRSKQFCNLSEVVVRPEDDLDDLLEKVECATWIGTIQSTFTHFPYLSKEWKENCDEERLLGVSLTGQMDNPELMTEETFKALKNRAIKVAKRASGILGINMPAAITCVKPSGTVSQLVNSASGLHVRYSPYYIRRYRISATDPLFKMLESQGVLLTPENGQENLPENEVSTWVLSFVIKSPENAITRYNVSALDQLEYYKKVQKNWCEHNASCTIYVRDDEWFLVGNWVYENWDFVGGLSFLPYDGGIYKQAPYEEITKEQYEELKAKQVVIDYSKLSDFEKEDNTEGSQTFSCIGDKCTLN